MDSQFISILIGVGVIVGLPLLEKLIDKIKQGSNSQSIQQRPQRQVTPPPRPRRRQPERQQQPVSAPVQLVEEEGARVTDDTPVPFAAAEPAPVSPQIEELRKAVIWGEILNNPKFKDF